MGAMDRRALLLAGTAVAGAGVVSACGGTSSTRGSEASGTDAALALAAIPVGGGVVLTSEEVVVTQPSEGTVKAFTAVCPHQGCLVSTVKENQIVCPCHQSVFSAEDGSVQSGPAPTGLAPAVVRIENGNVVLG